MASEFDFDRNEFVDLKEEVETAEKIARDIVSECVKNDTYFVVPSRVIWKLWDNFLKGDVK